MPKSLFVVFFFAASLQLDAYITISENVCYAHTSCSLMLLFNRCGGYADCKKISFFHAFEINRALKWPFILTWPNINIFSKTFTCIFMIILYCWIGMMLTKMYITIICIYFVKFALKWPLTLHGHMLSSCLDYFIHASAVHPGYCQRI